MSGHIYGHLKERPCPFCGNAGWNIGVDMPGKLFIQCATCKAGGPIADTVNEAMRQWNKRETDKYEDDLK